MRIRQLFASAVAVAVSSVQAATWYVSPTGTDAAGRGSAEAPFRTLQYAHDAAGAEDLIRLYPGEYVEGSTTPSENPRPSRLVVSKKLTFEAAGGRHTAAIVGQLSSEGTGYGTDGTRCVYVKGAGYGSIFRNLTFKKGSTRKNGVDGGKCTADKGGGLAVEGTCSLDKNADVFKAYAIDCDFEDCRGQWGAAMYGGTAIRCHFTNCRGGSWGSVVASGAIWSCVIEGCAGDSATGDPRPVLGNGVIGVNCTIVDCERTGCERSCNLYNCVFWRQEQTAMGTTYAVSDPALPKSTYTACEASTETYPFIAPAIGDFSLRSGTVIASKTGLTSDLRDRIALPEGVEYVDYNGDAIHMNWGTCQLGAVQTVRAPVGGRVDVPAGTVADGHWCKAATYAYAVAWPKTVVLKPSSANFLRYSLSGFSGLANLRYAQEDGTLHLCHPPCPGDYTTLAEQTYAYELWCDPSADASGADGSVAKPFPTIQEALNKAATLSGVTLVRAKPGNYYGEPTTAFDHPTRVLFPSSNYGVVLKSTDGAAKTTIWGAADPDKTDVYPGCGPNAVRCVAVANNWIGRAIQGFTLKNGHSNQANYKQDLASDKGGAVYYPSDDAKFQVLDCVIEDCGSVRAPVYCGFYSRCAFYRCQGYGGVTRNCDLVGCYVDPSCVLGKAPADASPNKVLGSETRTYQSTCPNVEYAGSGANMFQCNGYFPGASVASGWKLWGTVFSSSSWVAQDPPVYDVAEVSVANAANGDYRLIGNSPAALAGILPAKGSADWGTWASNYAGRVSSGLDGGRIRVNANGVPMPGCYQVPVAGTWIGVNAGGKIVYADGTTGAKVPAEGETVDVTVTSSVTRPCSGLTVNGADYGFDRAGIVRIPAADIAAAGGLDLVPETIASTDWYVDAVNGNDANNGFFPGKAKKKLVEVFKLGTLLAGDTVHAAAGTYDQGQMSCGGSDPYARVSVKEGVTLVADEGAEKTFIVGAPDTTSTGDANGLGRNAVRGVYLAGNGATLKGFTVCGGYTRPLAEGESDWTIQVSGGGVCAYTGGRGSDGKGMTIGDGAWVFDCVISNNYAACGGGIRWLNAVRCKLLDNHAVTSGGALQEANLHGCLVNRSYSGQWYDQAACYNFCRINFSTIGPDNWTFDGKTANRALHRSSSDIAWVNNSLILGVCSAPWESHALAPFSHTVFAQTAGTYPIDDTCTVCNGEGCEVDADLRPIVGANPAVDAGDAATLGVVPAGRDASGFQRVMNGTIDAGALEADWRARYAADLTKSKRFVIGAATPNAVETAERSVRLVDGQELQATWFNPNGRPVEHELTFKVGTGTLHLTVNGMTTDYAASATPYTVTIPSSVGETALAFAHEGEGASDLISTRALVGMSVIIR